MPIFAGISPASLASCLSPTPPEAGVDACTTKFGGALHHWHFPRRMPCRAMGNCGQKNTAACCQTAVYFSEMVYKPNSVPLVGRRSLIWDRRYRLPQATYPESTRIIRADSPKRTLPVMMLRLPLSLDGGILRRTPARRAGASIPYLVLHPVGFAMPAMSPWPRCAFTTPFHPCHSDKIGIRRYIFCGTFPHSRRCQREWVGITHHRALRCSDFPPGLRRATARPFHNPYCSRLII